MPINYEPIISVTDVNDEVWFDIVNRTILPKNEENIEDALVKNDKNSRNFGFHIQRYFEDEDLSTKKIRIHYVNSLGQPDIASAHSIGIIDSDEEVLSFKWLVGKKACLEGGDMKFAIEFYNTTETYSLFTKPIVISVAEGIDNDISIIEPEYEWFSEYSARMNVLEENMESFNRAVDNGEFDGAYTLNTFANAFKGNKSGEVVRIDDVASNGHNIKVTVDTNGKNLLNPNATLETIGSYLGVKLSKNQYPCTLSITLKDGATIPSNVYFGFVYYKVNTSNPVATWLLTNTGVQNSWASVIRGDAPLESIDTFGVVAFPATQETWKAIFQAFDVQLEKGTSATDYTPYVDPTSVKVGRYGTNFADINTWAEQIVAKNPTCKIVDFDGRRCLKLVNAVNTTTFNLPTYCYGIKFKAYNVGGYNQSFMQFFREDINDWGYISAATGEWLSRKVYYTAPSQKMTKIAFYCSNTEANPIYLDLDSFMAEQSYVETDYEPYKGETYTPNADGTVVGVTSLHPVTTLITDTNNTTIECEYNRDTNIVLNDIITRLTNLESAIGSISGGVS